MTLVEFYEKHLMIHTKDGPVKPPPLRDWQRIVLEEVERGIPIPKSKSANPKLQVLIDAVNEYRKHVIELLKK